MYVHVRICIQYRSQDLYRNCISFAVSPSHPLSPLPQFRFTRDGFKKRVAANQSRIFEHISPSRIGTYPPPPPLPPPPPPPPQVRFTNFFKGQYAPLHEEEEVQMGGNHSFAKEEGPSYLLTTVFFLVLFSCAKHTLIFFPTFLVLANCLAPRFLTSRVFFYKSFSGNAHVS